MTEITLQEQLTVMHNAILSSDIAYSGYNGSNGLGVLKCLFEVYKLANSDFICHELQYMGNFYATYMREEIKNHTQINVDFYDEKVKEFNEGLNE